MVKRPAISLIGLAILFAPDFAVYGQVLANTAKPDVGPSQVYLLDARKLFGGRGPDEQIIGCGNPELVKVVQRNEVGFVSKWRSTFARSVSDVRQIDLEGLKKLLQRDPKDTRPLLINFWATWCDGCREEFPDLVKIDNNYRDKGLNFVAVSLDDAEDVKTKVEPFLKGMKARMPVVLLNLNGGDTEVAIHVVDPTWTGDMPATFLYDKDGKVVFKHFGKIKTDELRAAIDKAVGSKQ